MNSRINGMCSVACGPARKKPASKAADSFFQIIKYSYSEVTYERIKLPNGKYICRKIEMGDDGKQTAEKIDCKKIKE